MTKTELTGILENMDGIWLLRLTLGHIVALDLEDFEGELVKVTKYKDKILIELIKKVEAEPLRARELCTVGGR